MHPKYASLRNKQQTTPTLKIQTRVRYANIRNSNFLEKKAWLSSPMNTLNIYRKDNVHNRTPSFSRILKIL